MSRQAQVTPEAASAAFAVDSGDELVSDSFGCGPCGDGFLAGQQAVQVYVPWANIAGKHREVVAIHLRCYQDEEIAS